ncbi:MAG TPA: M1 family metallopeptidase, partial [Bacteroidota bacterium]|nr:M1 family metallopeptidase [Bacteroidota bacterium]
GLEMELGGWGRIDITKMNVRGGEELKSRMQFIHPDDDNEKDQTVFRVPLSKPVLPNQTLTVELEFTAQLPTIFARTGFHGNFFMVAQWFPKIGVYEPAGMRYATKGQWNCHQLHSNSEFYADYGIYDVDMTVPKEFVVGATGLLQKEKENPDGTKTLWYRAEDVHDFAWTASPDFSVVEDQWQHVKIRLLFQADREGQVTRHLESAKAALGYFERWLGKYPYPNLTIVDPLYGGFGAAGMEYPTLITGGSFWGMPVGLKLTELVTIHEFGHQYWYGLVANNEFEEAWLDEGFNQYSETRIMDETYGKKTAAIDFLGYRQGDLEFARSGYAGLENPKIAPTFARSWDYKAGGYGVMTYNKTAVFMTTLERMIGRPVMDEIMRTYFERWKFRHPSTKDFVAVVNQVVSRHHGGKFGKDLSLFFDQVLYGSDVCDYELTTISNRAARGIKGIVDDKKEPVEGSSEKDREIQESYVRVSRLGEVKMPVNILVHFDSGKEVREHWDGEARWKDFRYSGEDQIVWAKVDPDEVLVIDINLLNNSKTEQPDRSAIWKYAVKFLFWVQNVLQFASIF